MATNRKASGSRVQVSSSGAIVSGKPVVQSNFFGIALGSVAGASINLNLGVDGIWNIPVPASTVAGDFLYVPSSAGGVLLTTSTDATAALTRTSSNTNAPVAKAVTARDAAGNADVFILPPGAVRSATQV